jgi:CheY-like chemotaxis protein
MSTMNQVRDLEVMVVPAETSGPPRSYEVSCQACSVPFDALQAGWCSCLVTERSLVCPACSRCFCKAAAAYKRTLWSNAPRALWDRKFAEHHQSSLLPENPDPQKIVRPLVLVVDDEHDIRRIAARTIGRLGYGLVVAQNGEEGLELAMKYRPDVVLSDALMPRMDGREMCRRIKADPDTAGAKVVVMTALYTSVKHKSEAFRVYGVDDYLSKPLDPVSLEAILKKQLATPA